jgi:8-hydroxy-5-deazaflavin:NADPH oxidoreductase
MRIAVLGTGSAGRVLAARFAELGHEVTIGTRDAAATSARTEPDRMGNPAFPQWQAAHPQVALADFAVAAAGAELVVNATGGAESIPALTLAGADNLAGKVVMDIANPLDHSLGFPPSLLVKDTDSLGEQIQRAFPGVRVVKTLNTMNASLMADPGQLAEGGHTTFVAGNDGAAKQTVTALLESLGHRDVIDLGDITAARGTEMILPLWLRLMGTLGTPVFNIKVVR